MIQEIICLSEGQREKKCGERVRENKSGEGRKMDKFKSEEKKSASCIINELNKFCRQGPGGQFDLKGYSSVTTHCILCEKNCICMMKKCKGPPLLPNSPVTNQVRRIDTKSFIPGLVEGSAASSTLTYIETTNCKRIPGGRNHALRYMNRSPTDRSV